MPFSVRSTSVQPVKRFSRFQVDSPWRIRTSLYIRESLGDWLEATRHFRIAGCPPRLTRNKVKFLIDNWMLIAVAFASGGMLLWPAIQGATGGGLSAAQAVQLINRERAVVV